MAHEFSADKNEFEALVLADLKDMRGIDVKRTDQLRTGLGYDERSVRDIARSLLEAAAEQGRRVTFPSPAYYDACKTVGDLVDLLYGRIR
jgi:hypothetical protein